MMLFIFAIVAALVSSECKDKFDECGKHASECGSSDRFDSYCMETCGKCGGKAGKAEEDTTTACVDCLNSYFGDLENKVKKTTAKKNIAMCRSDYGITKEQCDADPCYQTTYKGCRKDHEKKMSFEEWSDKCIYEANACAEKAAAKKKMYNGFCERELDMCQHDLHDLASQCETVQNCLDNSLPTAVKCGACLGGKDEDDEEEKEFDDGMDDMVFDAKCLAKEGITANQCENKCALEFRQRMEHCERWQDKGCSEDAMMNLFDCAGGPRKCVINKQVGYAVGNGRQYGRRRQCCSEANSAWDATFTKVLKCCERGSDPTTADGCKAPLPCVKAGAILPKGRKCCSDANANGKMCVEKPRVCQECDCQKWDGKNYSHCAPRPRSKCTRFCVMCENDGVTPMKGGWGGHKARCKEYANGGAEAQLKDLLRELLF